MIQFHGGVRSDLRLMQLWSRRTCFPRPGISKPDRGQDAKAGGFWSKIRDRNLDQDVLDVNLGIFHQHVEVTVFVEHSGVEQFEFGLILTAPSVLSHEL